MRQLLRLLDNDAVQGEPGSQAGLLGASLPCRVSARPRPAAPTAPAGAAAPPHSQLFPLPLPASLSPPPCASCPPRPLPPAAEDVEGVKELVEDYLERNQDDFEEFDAPDALCVCALSATTSSCA